MISDEIKKIENAISRKCKETGRNQAEVKLIAVSKTNPISAIEEALACGQVNFGENKAQEFRDKTKLFDHPNIIWHYIGHLQTNKVKYVINSAEYIHSVETVKLAEAINKKAEQIDKVQKIFLELNTSGEESKFGLRDFDDVLKHAEYCESAANLDLAGVMTMAPFTDDESVIRNAFRKTKENFERLKEKGFGVKEISMGMTNDFEIAIEEGATMVRVGTAIFGQRDLSKSWKEK